MKVLTNFASVFLDLFESHQSDRPLEAIDALSIEEAYRVQRMVIEARIGKGDRHVGYKVGCTSQAIRRQFGLTEPICGYVLAPRVYEGNVVLKWADFYQPAVEPEFVLRIGKDLRDEVGKDESLIDAIEYLSPGIELHNYRFWFGEPTIQELIASNGIHAGLVIGDTKVRPQDFDWDMEGVGMFPNDRLAVSGIGAEVMGGPMNSLRWLVNHLVRRGNCLRTGDVVIPGSPVALVSVNPGDRMCARCTHLGAVEALFE